MTSVKKGLLWYLLLSKRLLKKKSFPILLCLIPVLVFAMRSVALQDSGVVRIVLCQENQEDELSSKIVKDLLEEGSIILFSKAETAEEAYEAVLSKNADAAWIFPDKMQEKLDAYTAGDTEQKLVKMIEREDNVLLRLSGEKLYGALYRYFPYSLFQNYVRSVVFDGYTISEEELTAYYAENRVQNSLFVPTNFDGEAKEGKVNYLLAPLRGMLALVVTLCGFAASMYYLQDKKQGFFDRMSMEKREAMLPVYQLSAMMWAGIAVIVGLFFTGDFLGLFKEILLMALYILMNIGFTALLTVICGNEHRLGALIPVLMLFLFVLSPIFFEIRALGVLRFIVPGYSYLNAVHNDSYMMTMVGYIVAVFFINYILYLIRCKKN